jgi:predicted pyridoxine 5'-phosphate oxidase superfamily flavin-nucleotide-binding protein
MMKLVRRPPVVLISGFIPTMRLSRRDLRSNLLRAGGDINTIIRGWLGHVSLDTTNIYAEIDLEMKAKALANCELVSESKPEALAGTARSNGLPEQAIASSAANRIFYAKVPLENGQPDGSVAKAHAIVAVYGLQYRGAVKLNRRRRTMGILTEDMKRVVAEQKLGFVATVGADGAPNLSPKGTMLVLDDDRIMFAEIRSPATIANLAENPGMEINFVDQFSRKGYRFKGTAAVVPRGGREFVALIERFAHSQLVERIRAIVVLRVAKAAALTSPAYDAGATEPELRRSWRAYFESIQPMAQDTEH